MGHPPLWVLAGSTRTSGPALSQCPFQRRLRVCEKRISWLPASGNGGRGGGSRVYEIPEKDKKKRKGTNTGVAGEGAGPFFRPRPRVPLTPWKGFPVLVLFMSMIDFSNVRSLFLRDSRQFSRFPHRRRLQCAYSLASKLYQGGGGFVSEPQHHSSKMWQ